MPWTLTPERRQARLSLLARALAWGRVEEWSCSCASAIPLLAVIPNARPFFCVLFSKKIAWRDLLFHPADSGGTRIAPPLIR